MNVNSGKPWSKLDLFDLRNGLSGGKPISEVADFLARDLSEVYAKASELVAYLGRDEIDPPLATMPSNTVTEPTWADQLGRRVQRRTGRE